MLCCVGNIVSEESEGAVVHQSVTLRDVSRNSDVSHAACPSRLTCYHSIQTFLCDA
jgi:hypothetical protein